MDNLGYERDSDDYTEVQNSRTGQNRSYTVRNLNQVCKVHSTSLMLRLRSVLPHNYALCTVN